LPARYRTLEVGQDDVFDARAWFLRIVRNTCWSVRAQSVKLATEVFDEQQHNGAPLTYDPETLLLHAADASLVDETLGDLSDRFREFLVLRELEGLSYQELADVMEIPVGTVMSGLSRARQAFRRALELRRQPPAGDSATQSLRRYASR